MIKILHCHWLNKNKYNLGKLNLTRLWVLVTIYAKEYKAFCPSYNLPKVKKKDKVLLYLSKNPKFEGLVIEWEGVKHSFHPDKV